MRTASRKKSNPVKRKGKDSSCRNSSQDSALDQVLEEHRIVDIPAGFHLRNSQDRVVEDKRDRRFVVEACESIADTWDEPA